VPEHPIEVISQIMADHRAVEALLDDFEAKRGQPDEVLRTIVRELSLHAGVEELVVYPVVESRVDGGAALNKVDLAQHEALKQVLVRLDGADPSESSAANDCADMKRLVTEHVTHEETTVLPKLAAALSPAELAELGDAFLKAKEHAPTHPHPHAPNRPPMNVVADSVAAVVDKIRDAAHRVQKH
jgi:hypothetical protein